MDSESRFLERVVLGALRQLSDAAFGEDGVTMLSVVEGDRTTVALTVTEDPPIGLCAGTGASFRFTRSQLRLLAELDVGITELAASAFRELLERLAESAVDRMAFMRAVHRRLATASAGGGPVADRS